MPRTRLSVSVGRSVSSPSAMLRALRKSKKRKPLIMTFGGAEVGLEDQSIRRIQSTILFSLRDWLLGGLIRVRDGYFHISNLEWGSGTEKMRCIFSSFPSSSAMREKREWKNKKFLYPKTMNGMALCVIRNFAEFLLFLLFLLFFFS